MAVLHPKPPIKQTKAHCVFPGEETNRTVLYYIVVNQHLIVFANMDRRGLMQKSTQIWKIRKSSVGHWCYTVQREASPCCSTSCPGTAWMCALSHTHTSSRTHEVPVNTRRATQRTPPRPSHTPLESPNAEETHWPDRLGLLAMYSRTHNNTHTQQQAVSVSLRQTLVDRRFLSISKTPG